MGHDKTAMVSGKEYFRTYKDIIVYHDYQPLLLFWNISDIANNRVLWSTYWDYKEMGAESAYIQYALYFCVSLGMLFSLPNLRSCARFVAAYLLLYIFSVIRYVGACPVRYVCVVYFFFQLLLVFMFGAPVCTRDV